MYSLADDLDTVCASPQTVRNEPSLPFTDPTTSFKPSAQKSLVSCVPKISVNPPVAKIGMPKGVHPQTITCRSPNVEGRGHGAIFQGSDAQPGVKLERGQSVWAGIGGTDFARGILVGIFNETLARACWRIAGQCTSSIFSRIPNIHGGAFVEFPTIAISTPWISPRIHHPACSNCSGSGKP